MSLELSPLEWIATQLTLYPTISLLDCDFGLSDCLADLASVLPALYRWVLSPPTLLLLVFARQLVDLVFVLASGVEAIVVMTMCLKWLNRKELFLLQRLRVAPEYHRE